jgi:hypothetical protein
MFIQHGKKRNRISKRLLEGERELTEFSLETTYFTLNSRLAKYAEVGLNSTLHERSA